ncbi:hypothetical protein FO519_006049 [Halicephalobus sp. NKZ332]|nr:hypothetical protein FO519_006049 [Halicephalobus sp. NKZ332]
MGSGASTTKVDRIRIDQNGDIWKQKKDGTEKLCRPPSSKNNLTNIGKRLRNSASSLNSKSGSEHNKSMNLQKSLLETAEAKRIEAERQVDMLQREICLLELRNTELADEVHFLKEQAKLYSTDDVDSLIGIQNIRQRGNSISTETDIESIKAQAKLERELYENLITKLQSELKGQQERFHRKLQFEQEMREKMEDVVRIHLGDSFLYDAKNSLAHDTLPVKPYDGPKPLCRNLLSSHGRLTTPHNKNSESVETIKEEQLDSSESDNNEFSKSRHSIAQILSFDDNPVHKNSQEKEQAIRPSTADVNNSVIVKSELGRGDSAPTLHKRSKSRERRMQMRKKREQDKESIGSIEDEIEDILNSSFSSISVGSHKRVIVSAKSRDSGYLGESGHIDLEKPKMP